MPLFNPPSIQNFVRQIVGFNRSWHSSQKRYGEQHPLATLARDKKSALQVELLRSYPHDVWLEEHNITGKEPLFTVKLSNPVYLNNNEKKDNADHLPNRIARELLTHSELQRFVR